MSGSEKMTVLAVGGHPSDIFPNIGGTVAKHVERGDRVVLLTLTMGVEVHTEKLLGQSEDEIKKATRGQGLAGAACLGVDDYQFLDLGDTPLIATRENLIELGETIQDIRPDLIICAHCPYHGTGWGGDHGEAARMLELAPTWRQHYGREPHPKPTIWFSQHDHTIILNHPVDPIPNVFVDITDVIDKKIDASAAGWGLPPEQREEMDTLFRKANGNFGMMAGVDYAEPFERPWQKRDTVEHLSA